MATGRSSGLFVCYRRVLGIAVVLLIVGVFNAPRAAAATITDNIVPTATFWSYCAEGSPGNANPCQTDNSTLTYYMDSYADYKLEAVDDQTVNFVMGEYGSNTHLSTTYDSAPSFSGGAETDIIYQEGSVPGGDQGYTWCNDNSPGGYKCDQQYVRIEGGGAYTRGLTCHESGHAVGLTHGSQAYPVEFNDTDALDCMRKPTFPSQLLGANSIGNVNDVY